MWRDGLQTKLSENTHYKSLSVTQWNTFSAVSMIFSVAEHNTFLITLSVYPSQTRTNLEADVYAYMPTDVSPIQYTMYLPS